MIGEIIYSLGCILAFVIVLGVFVTKLASHAENRENEIIKRDSNGAKKVQ